MRFLLHRSGLCAILFIGVNTPIKEGRMYLDFKVDIPVVHGKITYREKAGTEYVYYEYDRIYDKNTQKTNPKRVTIGKRDHEDPSKMLPNRNFLQYFPDAELPEEKDRVNRSSCLRVGTWMVIRKIIRDYGLEEILSGYMPEKDVGLFLDLATYTIICEDNAAQYYPDYAYNHPLLTPDMRIYSDSTVSRLLSSMTDDQSVGFLNEWNEGKSRREKIYISYDATNKNCQAGDVDIVEFGHAKVDMGVPIFNYTVAYDRNNEEPLFYEKYSGSLTDTVQLKYMLEKVEGYGYKHVGFILDRGYFSKANIRFMDEHHYSFIIMVKGMKALVNGLILSKKGSFENKWAKYIEDYDVYGTTVRAELYEGDERTRYFHIYHNTIKEGVERAEIAKKIRKMKEFAKKQVNREYEFGPAYHHYFRIHYNDKNHQFQFLEDRKVDVSSEAEGRCQGGGCSGGNGGGCSGGGNPQSVEIVADCRAVVAAKVGKNARRLLELKAISVFDIEIPVEEALSKITSYYHKLDNRAFNIKQN